MKDTNDGMISTQTLRMLRSAIENSSQYSDEELVATSVILGSLYATVPEIPTFLPQKEQMSFFTNMIACFVIGGMINSGLINPKIAPSYISDAMDEKSIPDIDTSPDDDDAVVVVGGKQVN